MRRSTMLFAAVIAVVFAVAPVPALAQQDDPDLDLNFSQPDFSVVTLPTTLRVPRYKSAFRVTHRFLGPLGSGDFGDLLDNFFQIDSGAQIGLEYRFGLMRGLQVGIHRTSDRTIEFFSQYSLLQQSGGSPFGLAAFASIEGTNNFHDSEDDDGVVTIESSTTPALGAILSFELGRNGALYAEPIWVNNSNRLPSELVDDNDTFIVGLGARIRIRPTIYLVGEVIPRVGHDPGVSHGTFGIEKRAGGHTFQLNFSNGFGTTMGQIARGGTSNDDWYLGFSISRKFF